MSSGPNRHRDSREIPFPGDNLSCGGGKVPAGCGSAGYGALDIEDVVKNVGSSGMPLKIVDRGLPRRVSLYSDLQSKQVPFQSSLDRGKTRVRRIGQGQEERAGRRFRDHVGAAYTFPQAEKKLADPVIQRDCSEERLHLSNTVKTNENKDVRLHERRSRRHSLESVPYTGLPGIGG